MATPTSAAAAATWASPPMLQAATLAARLSACSQHPGLPHQCPTGPAVRPGVLTAAAAGSVLTPAHLQSQCNTTLCSSTDCRRRSSAAAACSSACSACVLEHLRGCWAALGPRLTLATCRCTCSAAPAVTACCARRPAGQRGACSRLRWRVMPLHQCQGHHLLPVLHLRHQPPVLGAQLQERQQEQQQGLSVVVQTAAAAAWWVLEGPAVWPC